MSYPHELLVSQRYGFVSAEAAAWLCSAGPIVGRGERAVAWRTRVANQTSANIRQRVNGRIASSSNGSRIGRGLKVPVRDAGWADGAARRGDCSRWLSSCGSRSLGRSHEGSKSRNWGHSADGRGNHGMVGRRYCIAVPANYFLFNIILNLRLRFKMMSLVEYCTYFKN